MQSPALVGASDRECSGDASRHPNGPAAVARGSGREARPEPAAAPDSRCTTSGCSAPAGEPRSVSPSAGFSERDSFLGEA